MMKTALFAVTLLSVALWSGCATGGGGHTGGNIIVKVTAPLGQNIVGVTLTLQLSADVKNTDNKGVTWTVTQNGGACSPACGSISSSGLYSAPSSPPTPATVDVTATSVVNPNASDKFQLRVSPITVTVIPGPATVGAGLQQQLTAAVTPDQAPQTVNWAIASTDCLANDCGTLSASGLYTAPNVLPSGGPFSVQATSTIDSPNWIGATNITVVNSRLNGTYAFRFSGYDSTNKPVAIAGNFVVNSNGAIQGGVQDELTAAGHNHCSILSSSSYSQDINSHGTITLKTSAGACAVNTRSYKFVLDADGDGRMIEFGDGVGRGSGQFSQASSADFKTSALKGGFAFGLTGSDIISGKRAGSAGMFVSDHLGSLSAGRMDINDGGAVTTSADVTGTYNIAADGSGTLTLVDNDHGAATYQFAIYVVGGNTQNATNPFTLYMISTDPLANKPAVVGSVVFQDPTETYDKTALDSFSVSNLTGVDNAGSNALVSLTAAKGDGAGNISASYDANNAGTIVAAKTFSSTYATLGSGRYTVDWLNPAVHFVLYLTAANRGFLLDIDPALPSAVYSGTMDQQPGSGFAAGEFTGPFQAATGSSGTAGVNPVAMNLLFSLALPDFTVAGTQDVTGVPSPENLAGNCKFDFNTTTGSITLTAPAASKFIMYPLDNPKQSNFLIQHFVMINVDSANADPAIIFAER
ncbi:MAG: hypothetical protein HY010_20625 [Acidobacteria bacterium]|nr:hypothetical protein [Acidobacteriota bacterium]